MADAFERRIFNNQMRTDKIGRFSRAMQSGQGFNNTSYGRTPHVRSNIDFNRPSPTSQFNAEYGTGGANKTPVSQSRSLLDTWKDKIRAMPGSQPAKPNPYAAKPTGQLTAKDAGSLLGLGSMTVTGAVTAPLILGGSEDASRKWRRLGYSSPEAYQKAISQNANRERPITSDNPVRPSQPAGEATVYAGDTFNNTDEINKRLDEQKKERAAALAVTKGDYDHSSGSYVGQDVAFVPDSTLNNGRDNTRTNKNGVVQKGTDMGRSFNDLLATTNTSGYQPFSSNQLPTTAGSPDTAVSPKTQAILAGIQAGKETDMSIDGYQPQSSAARAGVLSGIQGGARTDRGIQGTSTAADGVFAGIQGGQKTDQGIAGYKAPGSTSRLDAALSDTAGINSYMSKFSSGDQERAANRAFLDTEGSMEGLRAKEAVNGVVYAGGQHYISGTSGDDKAIGIDRIQARDISNGNSSAQSLLAAHINKNKNVSEDTPASFQNPLSVAGSAVKSAFAGGAQTDFALNNNQGAPQIGVGPVVKPSIVENYDFTKPGAEEDYFKKLDSGAFFK